MTPDYPAESLKNRKLEGNAAHLVDGQRCLARFIWRCEKDPLMKTGAVSFLPGLSATPSLPREIGRMC